MFIRRCDAPAFAIATYRLAISSVLLLATGSTRLPTLLSSFSKRDWLLGALSGFFLVIHFSAWIKFLEITSVASSVVLVSTAPFWAALGAWLFLKASVRWLFFLRFFVRFHRDDFHFLAGWGTGSR